MVRDSEGLASRAAAEGARGVPGGEGAGFPGAKGGPRWRLAAGLPGDLAVFAGSGKQNTALIRPE